jgi:hypothetical protein
MVRRQGQSPVCLVQRERIVRVRDYDAHAVMITCCVSTHKRLRPDRTLAAAFAMSSGSGRGPAGEHVSTF